MGPVFLYFFQNFPNFSLGVSVRSASGLGLQLGYLYYVSTMPTAFSSFVTVALQDVVKYSFKFKDPLAVL